MNSWSFIIIVFINLLYLYIREANAHKTTIFQLGQLDGTLKSVGAQLDATTALIKMIDGKIDSGELVVKNRK